MFSIIIKDKNNKILDCKSSATKGSCESWLILHKWHYDYRDYHWVKEIKDDRIIFAEIVECSDLDREYY